MTSPIRSLLGLLLLLSTSGYAVAQVRTPQAQIERKPEIPAEIQSEAPARISQAPPLGRPELDARVETTSVRVFQLDNQCEDFVGTVLQLPRATALSDAVGAAIQESSTLDFEVAGYRVSEGPIPREVTVDFRLPPDTMRTLESLSMCEGRSLYGSIRQTLTANGQFGVSQVRFTLAGRELR